MIATIPNNFNIESHILKYQPSDYNIPDFSIDSAIFILNQIYELPINNKLVRDKTELNNGYVELSSKYLQRHVKYYYKYIKYFINTGVIESDNFFIPPSANDEKTKCIGYKFSESFRHEEPNIYYYSKEFSEKISKEMKKSVYKIHSDYSHLVKMFYPKCNLRIDRDAALNFVATKKDAQLLDKNLWDRKKNTALGKITLRNPIEQYNYSVSMINAIHCGNFECKVDEKVHRMYTCLTNIYSPLRNYITYRGEKLYSIDIVNSQPYLSLILFNKSSYNRNNIIYKICREVIPNPAQTLPKLFRSTQLSNNEDFNLYRSLVGKYGNETHDLYSYMMDNQASYSSRSDAKAAMFEVLFSSNRYVTKSKQQFTSLFPTVDEVFRTLKDQDHSILSVLLQNIESHLVLKTITKKIAQIHPNAPIFTVHDSIVTTETYVDTVHRTMENILTQKVGTTPKLKKEKWCNSTLQDVLSIYSNAIP